MFHRSCLIYTAALSLGTYHNGCHMFSAAHEQGDFVPWGINNKRTKICFFLSCFVLVLLFFLKDELIHELKQTLNAIKLEEKGVYVQASTLGSLEALLEFLKTSEVPVSTTVLYLMPLILCLVSKCFLLTQKDYWLDFCVFLQQYSGINIGPVHKKDVMKASVMLEHDPQ